DGPRGRDAGWWEQCVAAWRGPPWGGGSEQLGRVVVEHGEAVDQLRGDPPLLVGRYAAQQPGMERLPRERFAHGGLRLPSPQEEPQPGAGPNGVRIWLRHVHQLEDFVGFVEEHRPRG